MMGCPICDHENRDDIEAEVANGFPKKIIAQDIGCSIEDILDHMENHSKYGQPGGEDATMEDQIGGHYKNMYPPRDSYEKYDVLNTNMERLTDRFDSLMEKDHLDKDDTKQIVSMARELRQTVMNLAELEGELHKELALTRAQFEALKEAVLRELDPDTQEVIINAIDESQIEVEADQ